MREESETVTEILRRRILRGLYAGVLHSGDRLPSARAYAEEFGVDYRVVLAAYRELAGERIVEIRPRGGIYIAASADLGGGVPALAEDWVVETLMQGLAREIPLVELHEWLRRAVETLRLRAVAVAATRDQAAGLCRELRDDFGLEASGLEGSAFIGGSIPAEVRSADLLVTTEALAREVQRVGEQLGIPYVVAAVRPDLIGAEWRLLLKSPVYVIVEDARFVDMLREFFASTPGAENLRPLVAGRDDLASIPDGAPTYVTSAARDRIAAERVRGRILPAARAISADTAREIVRFIVRSNLEVLESRGRSAGTRVRNQ